MWLECLADHNFLFTIQENTHTHASTGTLCESIDDEQADTLLLKAILQNHHHRQSPFCIARVNVDSSMVSCGINIRAISLFIRSVAKICVADIYFE